MTSRDRDLDRITELLGQCLGRIDEHAYRLQEAGDDPVDAADPGTLPTEFDLDTCDALEREAELLLFDLA